MSGMGSNRFDIIITSDRTIMTDHHGKEFIGFMATSPSVGLPEFLWMYLCCPKPKVDRYGRPLVAPYGLRKVEAKLLESGFNAAVIDPDYIDRYMENAKILMVGHHDYFAFGPPSSEWWLITGKEPVNRRSFIKLMSRASIKRAKKKGLKIVAGGPAAWQWFWEPDLWKGFGVDVVLDGEAEKVIVPLVKDLIDGKEVPNYIYVGANMAPDVEEIPEIKNPSVNGLVEIMRGCPRGCSFCSVTLKTLRHYPLEKIEREILVNVRHGIVHGILHSDDVLLYGSQGVIPEPEPLIKLHELALKHYKTIAWSHASLAAVVIAQRRYKLISKLMDIVFSKGEQDYIGVEVGLETGSPKLAKIIMPAKAAPFKVEEYPEIAEEAFAIMHEHRIISAATFILGLPGEEEDDVWKTVELLDRIKRYRSIVVPMIFVPMGALKADKRSGIKGLKLTRAHIEAMRKALWHSIYWGEDIISKFYIKGPKYALVRLLLKAFIEYAKWKASKIEEEIETYNEIVLSIDKAKERAERTIVSQLVGR